MQRVAKARRPDATKDFILLIGTVETGYRDGSMGKLVG